MTYLTWLFVLPGVSLFLLLSLAPALLKLYTSRISELNVSKRRAVLKELGIPETKQDDFTLIGFFHPYCNAGGGGERVLWTIIAYLQRTDPNFISVVYTGDISETKEGIIENVQKRFNIELNPALTHFVFLNQRRLVEDSSWPHFTLAGQSIGSMILVLEAMNKLIPDVYIDTMGYAFTFPVVRSFRVRKNSNSAESAVPVGAYVHFPTISTNMLSRVRSRKGGYANSNAISKSLVLSRAKLLYYRVFMYFYSGALQQACFLMANSSWTKGHVDSILLHKDPALDSVSDTFSKLYKVISPLSLLFPFSSWSTNRRLYAHTTYPPCETNELTGFPLDGRRLGSAGLNEEKKLTTKNEKTIILSLAQFRPEKEHATQLRALAALFKIDPSLRDSVRLVMVGGVRNVGDERRVEGLKELAISLGLWEPSSEASNVEFVINASHSEVLGWLSRASIGLSTMVDEHFGINVVELLAAGVIPVVHASAGPLLDIVVPYKGKPTGFHATDTEAFGRALFTALSLPPGEDIAMRERGRTWAIERFSRTEFEKSWEASGWRKWLPS